MLKKSLHFFTILMLNLTLAGQHSTYSKGYVILNSGDTIQGYVKDRSPEPFVNLYDRIRFKKNTAIWKKRYSPKSIKGYGYANNHFISVPYRTEQYLFRFYYSIDSTTNKSFFKLIQHSDYLLYLEQEFVQDDNSYLDSAPYFIRPMTGEMVRVTQGILGFKKKRLAEFFYDCPLIINMINNDHPSIKTVSQLYEFYHMKCL